jgi:hypothetical protein
MIRHLAVPCHAPDPTAGAALPDPAAAHQGGGR